MSQWTAYTNGQATISGHTETFANLTDIDGAGFVVSGGVQLSLPAVTSYVMNSQGPTLGASGLEAH